MLAELGVCGTAAQKGVSSLQNAVNCAIHRSWCNSASHVLDLNCVSHIQRHRAGDLQIFGPTGELTGGEAVSPKPTARYFSPAGARGCVRDNGGSSDPRGSSKLHRMPAPRQL